MHSSFVLLNYSTVSAVQLQRYLVASVRSLHQIARGRIKKSCRGTRMSCVRCLCRGIPVYPKRKQDLDKPQVLRSALRSAQVCGAWTWRRRDYFVELCLVYMLFCWFWCWIFLDTHGRKKHFLKHIELYYARSKLAAVLPLTFSTHPSIGTARCTWNHGLILFVHIMTLEIA